MAEYTDRNIPIICGECIPDHIEEGLQAMFEHILEAHPNYNQYEADFYATQWIEDAYDREDERNYKETMHYRGKSA